MEWYRKRRNIRIKYNYQYEKLKDFKFNFGVNQHIYKELETALLTYLIFI